MFFLIFFKWRKKCENCFAKGKIADKLRNLVKFQIFVEFRFYFYQKKINTLWIKELRDISWNKKKIVRVTVSTQFIMHRQHLQPINLHCWIVKINLYDYTLIINNGWIFVPVPKELNERFKYPAHCLYDAITTEDNQKTEDIIKKLTE